MTALVTGSPRNSFGNSDLDRTTCVSIRVDGLPLDVGLCWRPSGDVQESGLFSPSRISLPGLNAGAFLAVTSTAAPVREIAPGRMAACHLNDDR